MNAFHITHCAFPCINGAITSMVTLLSSAVSSRPANSSAVSMGAAPQPPPPMAAKKMSSWRQMTPFGHPGGSARVEHVDVIRRAGSEPALGSEAEASAAS